MKILLTAVFVAASLLAACAVVPAGPYRHHGPAGVAVVPYLPSVVVLGLAPFYFQQGFYYHYDRDHWFYSRSKKGPWIDLPRDHYPKEVRFKGRGDRHDRDRYYRRDRGERR